MLYLINSIYAALTGWAIGFYGTYYSKYDYQKYYYLLFYISFIYLGYTIGFDILPNILGLSCCILTITLITYPRLLNGHHQIH